MTLVTYSRLFLQRTRIYYMRGWIASAYAPALRSTDPRQALRYLRTVFCECSPEIAMSAKARIETASLLMQFRLPPFPSSVNAHTIARNAMCEHFSGVVSFAA